MFIAVSSKSAQAGGTIPASLEEGGFLLLMKQQNDGTFHQEAMAEGLDAVAQATKMREWDCEAVLCGNLEEAAFSILADYGITRYYAAGLPVMDALDAMEAGSLELIRAPSGESGGCRGHAHD